MTSEKNRIQKVLEASNIKLCTFISDVLGTSGRRLLEKLISDRICRRNRSGKTYSWSYGSQKETNHRFMITNFVD